ncbi:MAG TPA: hypothetical protein VE669_10865 [Actinomycetota bacterium]|jgi:hypothetical protein|nr:hypothetical protein [Actinomycetota bacterium]
MSTRIGTFERQTRMGYPVWLAGLLAVLIAVTLAFAAITVVRDRGDEAARVGGAHGTAANTPTELSGGLASAGSFAGVSANTPSELRSVLGAAALDLPAGLSRGIAAATGIVGSDANNTPSEVRGAIASRGVPAQPGPVYLNGERCHQCQ